MSHTQFFCQISLPSLLEHFWSDGKVSQEDEFFNFNFTRQLHGLYIPLVISLKTV